MSVVIFNMFDDFLISMQLSNPVVQHYLRRAKYIDQSRAVGISWPYDLRRQPQRRRWLKGDENFSI